MLLKPSSLPNVTSSTSSASADAISYVDNIYMCDLCVVIGNTPRYLHHSLQENSWNVERSVRSLRKSLRLSAKYRYGRKTPRWQVHHQLVEAGRTLLTTKVNP